MQGADVVTAARHWINTPFQHQGRVLGVGVDCVGLVVGVAGMLGLSVADKDGYPRTADGTLAAELGVQMLRVTDRQPGDVLLIRFGRQPEHVAIFTGGGIIHAYSSIGRCVNHGIDAKWERRIIGVYRFRELADG